MPEEKIINHGVLRGRQPLDFVAGTLPYEVRNPSAVWTPYVPPGEWQWKNGRDTMACVTFSAINSIEMQENLLTGQQVNYSDRWIAWMSGTTPEGNYLWKVADTIRKYGLVREESWPAPESFDWATYYKPPSAAKQKELLAEGKRWLAQFSIAYEWILDFKPATMVRELKHAPLQVVIPGHAIDEVANLGSVMDYFDSYAPFLKQRAQNSITDALKIVLTVKSMPNQTKVGLGKDGKTVYKLVPVATDFENFKKQANVEGIEVPNPIPPLSSY